MPNRPYNRLYRFFAKTEAAAIDIYFPSLVYDASMWNIRFVPELISINKQMFWHYSESFNSSVHCQEEAFRMLISSISPAETIPTPNANSIFL